MTLVRGLLPVSLHTFYFSFKTTFKAQMKKNRADSKRVQTKGVLVRWLCNSSITIPRIIWPRRDKVFTVFFFQEGRGRGREEGRKNFTTIQKFYSFILPYLSILLSSFGDEGSFHLKFFTRKVSKFSNSFYGREETRSSPFFWRGDGEEQREERIFITIQKFYSYILPYLSILLLSFDDEASFPSKFFPGKFLNFQIPFNFFYRSIFVQVFSFEFRKVTKIEYLLHGSRCGPWQQFIVPPHFTPFKLRQVVELLQWKTSGMWINSTAKVPVSFLQEEGWFPLWPKTFRKTHWSFTSIAACTTPGTFDMNFSLFKVA